MSACGPAGWCQRWTTTTRTFPAVDAGRRSVAVLRSVTLALHGGGVAPALIVAGQAQATSLPLTLAGRRSVTLAPRLGLRRAGVRERRAGQRRQASVVPCALRSAVSPVVSTAGGGLRVDDRADVARRPDHGLAAAVGRRLAHAQDRAEVAVGDRVGPVVGARRAGRRRWCSASSR